jgi:hypothetical protein
MPTSIFKRLEELLKLSKERFICVALFNDDVWPVTKELKTCLMGQPHPSTKRSKQFQQRGTCRGGIAIQT